LGFVPYFSTNPKACAKILATKRMKVSREISTFETLRTDYRRPSSQSKFLLVLGYAKTSAAICEAEAERRFLVILHNF